MVYYMYGHNIHFMFHIYSYSVIQLNLSLIIYVSKYKSSYLYLLISVQFSAPTCTTFVQGGKVISVRAYTHMNVHTHLHISPHGCDAQISEQLCGNARRRYMCHVIAGITRNKTHNCHVIRINWVLMHVMVFVRVCVCGIYWMSIVCCGCFTVLVCFVARCSLLRLALLLWMGTLRDCVSDLIANGAKPESGIFNVSVSTHNVKPCNQHIRVGEGLSAVEAAQFAPTSSLYCDVISAMYVCVRHYHQHHQLNRPGWSISDAILCAGTTCSLVQYRKAKHAQQHLSNVNDCEYIRFFRLSISNIIPKNIHSVLNSGDALPTWPRNDIVNKYFRHKLPNRVGPINKQHMSHSAYGQSFGSVFSCLFVQKVGVSHR